CGPCHVRWSAGRVRPDGLEHAGDREVVAGEAPGLDRAAVDVHGGYVEPGEGDHPARHVLVAAADDEHAVHALAATDGLDRVGDDLARDEAALHALGAHRDAVGDGDRLERLGHP